MVTTFVHARCHRIDWGAADAKSNTILIARGGPAVGVSKVLNGKIPICTASVPVRVAKGSSVKVVVGCIRHVAVRIYDNTLPVGPRRIYKKVNLKIARQKLTHGRKESSIHGSGMLPGWQSW